MTAKWSRSEVPIYATQITILLIDPAKTLCAGVYPNQNLIKTQINAFKCEDRKRVRLSRNELTKSVNDAVENQKVEHM